MVQINYTHTYFLSFLSHLLRFSVTCKFTVVAQRCRAYFQEALQPVDDECIPVYSGRKESTDIVAQSTDFITNVHKN